MVDQVLIDKLRTMMAHPESDVLDSIEILFNLFKQLAEENEKVKKKIDGIDLCVQFIVFEKGEELYRYWCSVRKGIVEFDEGDGPEVTVTLKTSRDIFGSLLTREADLMDAYKAGDLNIEGNLQDIKNYAEILLLVRLLITKLAE
ncbi:MAG: SCP2 sterol-binding domain-containing protein [Promethearchaeota archaeon]